jgi:hypothetical protein
MATPASDREFGHDVVVPLDIWNVLGGGVLA